MDNRDAGFVNFANPHTWLLSAEDLHDQAVGAFQRRGSSATFKFDDKGQMVHTLDAADRSIYLLSGFSIENLIKGHAIYQNANLIANGELARAIRTHKLHSIYATLKSVRKSHEISSFLERMSQGLVSWSRYPCALVYENCLEIEPIGKDYWETYISLFSSLRDSLRKKLTSGWTDCLGQFQRYEFE